MVGRPALRLVTSNPGKFREIRAIFAEQGLPLQWSRRALPEPQADDLGSVVRAKLAALPPDGGVWIVDDSGLFLPGLGGFPGVYSAYALRTIGLDGILRLLRGQRRSAVFRTVAGVWDGSRVRLFRGESAGDIVARARGAQGFGYDPIFRPAGWRETFAQVSLERKNEVSHRARAMRLAAAYLARNARLRRGPPAGKER